MAIAIAAGAVVSITLDSGNQIFVKGNGIYRVSMINNSSAPSADNSISRDGSFVGPYQSNATLTVVASGPCEYEEYASQNPAATRPQYFLGTFSSSGALTIAHPPSKSIGADALVSGIKYYSDGDDWHALAAGSASSWDSLTDKETADLPGTNTPLADALGAKQDTLVSGTNIKTVNGTSLLGSGNIVISGGSGSYPEALNFSALPGSPAEGDTYVVLQAQGVYFINRKPAGMYRYTSSAWVYLGEVPDGYFTDNVLRFFDNADVTKQLAFELSGISTGTTRTLTAPDASGTIALTSQLTTDVPVGPFVSITADRTLVVADNNMVGNTGATSRAITVPSGLESIFIGCSIEGPCTWVAGGGVTLSEDRPTGKGYNYCQLVRVGTNAYRVLGART